MRMVKVQEKQETLESAVKTFLLVKEAQHTGELTMDKYRKTLSKFVEASHDSIEYYVLESDVLSFLAAISDTSPARYNLPFQNINVLLNWIFIRKVGTEPLHGFIVTPFCMKDSLTIVPGSTIQL